MRRMHGVLIVLTLLAAALLSGCGGSAGPATIRIGMLPILDGLPMYVAEAEGYFTEAGVAVEFVPVSSAAERDQLMQAGQIDAMINDLVSTMLYNRDETQIVIVSFARTATETFPQFRVLVSADSGIDSLDGLRGVEIAVSEGTVIEYTTDRLLEGAGFGPSDIVTVAVPNIVERMTLLGSGQLQAANLPDPLASLAIQGGATVIIDDTFDPSIGNSVISFRADYVESNAAAVTNFMAAVERGAEAVNSDKDRWSDLLAEQGLVPEPLLGSYAIPDFPTGAVPSQAQFEDVLAWTQSEGLVDSDVNYADSVDDSFLP